MEQLAPLQKVVACSPALRPQQPLHVQAKAEWLLAEEQISPEVLLRALAQVLLARQSLASLGLVQRTPIQALGVGLLLLLLEAWI